jgi:ion channel-forming bestrophin family protein
MLSDTEKPNWFLSALRINGSVFPIILPRVLFFGGLGFLVSLAHELKLPIDHVEVLGDLTTNVACNLVLGLLLVFRTNAAYEKFWEGRKAWGNLVLNIRNLAREIQVSIPELEPTVKANKASTLKLLSAFAVSTKLHLRHLPLEKELASFIAPKALEKLNQAKNAPLEIALWVGSYIQEQYQQNHLDTSQRWAMNNLINEMVSGLTSCERILKTPVPIAYTVYLKRLLLIYCMLLPLGLVSTLHWWTGFLTALISFVLLGVEEIGNEIENPFGTDPNDLPLDEICNTVIENVESVMQFEMDDASLYKLQDNCEEMSLQIPSL